MVKNLSKSSLRVCLWTFTIIATAIIIGPRSLAYAADVTLAWTENSEPNLAGYYIYYKNGTSGVPYNGTGVDEGDSPIKIPLYDFANPANPEFTLHGLSDTQTTYLVLTAYDTDDNESSFSNEVSYQPSTPTVLNDLSISGDDFVSENNSAGFAATATFSDGTTQTVSDNASWSENSTHANINSSGVLTASEVTEDTLVTIQASYSIGGATKIATKVVTIIDVPISNLPPDTPTIVYPENYSGDVEVPLNITTTAFSDSNNDDHFQSQWQMSEQSDFSTPVVDITSDNYLTKFSVPHMALKSNQKYYVRVRFFDVFSTASNWSSTVEFTTAHLIVDLNGNGIADADEVDDSVDLNLDGIPDKDQPQIIKCVKSSDGSVSIGIEKATSTAEEIESLEIIDPDTISDTFNRPSDLIFGLFSYRLRVTTPGDTAMIRIYVSGEIFDSDVFYKYDTINGWYDYSEHTTFNDDGKSIILEVKDGGYGDSDGLANGIIVDPGGIASLEDSYSSFGSNVMGCFIATAAFGSKFEKHVQLLRRFRDLYLMPNSIGRAFVKAYYRYSPPMADFIAKHDILRTIVRWGLAPLIAVSWITLKIGSLSTVALMLIFMSCFIGFCMVRRKRKA
jgi:chitinase